MCPFHKSRFLQELKSAIEVLKSGPYCCYYSKLTQFQQKSKLVLAYDFRKEGR